MNNNEEYIEIIRNLVNELSPNIRKTKYTFDYYFTNIIYNSMLIFLLKNK